MENRSVSAGPSVDSEEIVTRGERGVPRSCCGFSKTQNFVAVCDPASPGKMDTFTLALLRKAR
jgi:hypothetical protein